jgi:MFS family permease
VKNPFADLPREVGVLTAVAIAVAVGFGVVIPAIPLFAQSFGVSDTAVGAVVSAFALMRFISALGGGRLVDRFGERLILASGIGIVAVSTGLAGLAQSYPQLLVLRGVGGIGSAMFTISATALLLRVVDAAHRGRASGLFQSGFLIGIVLGPAFGGFLTDASIRLPFFVYAVTLIVAGAIAAVFLSSSSLRSRRADVEESVAVGVPADTPEAHAAVDAIELESEPAAADSTTLEQAWSHAAYRAAVAVNFAVGFALFGLRFTLIPLLVTKVIDVGAAWIGIGLVCSSVAQAACILPASRIVDGRGRRPAMVLGSVVTAGGLLAVAALQTLPVFLLSMTAMGVGSSLISTAPAAVVGDVMHGRGGRVVAVFQMASDAGQIVGPLVAGWLTDHTGYGPAFCVGAGVLVLAGILSARMPETLPSRAGS